MQPLAGSPLNDTVKLCLALRHRKNFEDERVPPGFFARGLVPPESSGRDCSPSDVYLKNSQSMAQQVKVLAAKRD